MLKLVKKKAKKELNLYILVNLEKQSLQVRLPLVNRLRAPSSCRRHAHFNQKKSQSLQQQEQKKYHRILRHPQARKSVFQVKKFRLRSRMGFIGDRRRCVGPGGGFCLCLLLVPDSHEAEMGQLAGKPLKILPELEIQSRRQKSVLLQALGAFEHPPDQVVDEGTVVQIKHPRHLYDVAQEYVQHRHAVKDALEHRHEVDQIFFVLAGGRF